jgi:hypothetical protein
MTQDGCVIARIIRGAQDHPGHCDDYQYLFLEEQNQKGMSEYGPGS